MARKCREWEGDCSPLSVTKSGEVSAHDDSAIVAVFHNNSTEIGVGTVPIPPIKVLMRCGNHANEVAHRIPNSPIFEELGLIELVFSKVVELLAQLTIESARILAKESIQPLSHSALAGGVVCLDSNSHGEKV